MYRLTAALGLFLWLSPHYEVQLGPLLEVLRARDVLRGKLGTKKGGETRGGLVLGRKEVRKLVEEVSGVLCP